MSSSKVLRLLHDRNHPELHCVRRLSRMDSYSIVHAMAYCGDMMNVGSDLDRGRKQPQEDYRLLRRKEPLQAEPLSSPTTRSKAQGPLSSPTTRSRPTRRCLEVQQDVSHQQPRQQKRTITADDSDAKTAGAAEMLLAAAVNNTANQPV